MRVKEKVAVVSELRHQYKLVILLEITKLPKSTYFYHLKHTNLDDRNTKEFELIKSIFNNSRQTYGYRRITLLLKNQYGIVCNHKKVLRIMNCLGIKPKTIRKRKYSSYQGEIGKVAKNIINRDFEATAPNQKWTTDVTEFAFNWGKAYLSPILDMFNDEIISYDLSISPNFVQTQNMLSKAFNKFDNLNGLILHSDQGWQYQMKSYSKQLESRGIIQSMSRKGNCLDNGIMEQFFGKLKIEMFYGNERKYQSFNDFKNEIDNYIYWYNNERIQVNLKGLSPVQYRIQSFQRL